FSVFFFSSRRRHTRSKRDWSSDVCSSDLDNTTATNYRHGSSSGRISFAKIAEPLEVPDLLALQTESFDRLVGNERWAEQVAHAQEIGDDSVVTTSGLGEIFE